MAAPTPSPGLPSPEPAPSQLAALAQRLALEATRLRFFPLVALLERLVPGSAPVGGSGPSSEERVRFRHDPSLCFSAGDVAQVTLKQGAPDANDFRATAPAYFEVTTTFLGLTGSGTPLPYYLAEEVAQEDADHPHRREFLDLFHHRLLSLLYRAQAKYDLSSGHAPDGSDPWSRRLLALAGLDGYEAPPPGPFQPSRLLRLTPLLARRARSPRTLEVALEDVLGDALEGGQVRLREFIGSWTRVAPSQQTRLGRSNSTLGANALLGAKAYDQAGMFEIELGPVSHATYRDFLPGGALTETVAATVALFGRDAPEYRLRIKLHPQGVPRLQLSTKGTQAGLGRDTWLGSRAGRETWVTIGAS